MMVDWTKIYKKYRGQWVAVKKLSDTTVIASGKTLKETLSKAQRRGIPHPLVTQIPKEILPIVGVIIP